jgi:hypothetical protein
MNLANPPSNAALLDYLAGGFVDYGYDTKWLHREICKSHAYQRSWKSNETNKLDTRNFSRAIPRRLPAEVAYDAIVMATAGDQELKKLADEPKNRAIGLGNLTGLNRGGGGNRSSAYALAVFGRPSRATNCDCERSTEPSLLQTIYLQNDQETLSQIERGGGWLKQITKDEGRRTKKEAGDAQAEEDSAKRLAEVVREAYLRTLGREPMPEESARAVQHVHEAANMESGLRDVLWALINTKEFIVNH